MAQTKFNARLGLSVGTTPTDVLDSSGNLLITVPIANGGTGATTAEGALTALGIAKVYSNQYVLSGTTTNATETEIFVNGIASSRIPVTTNTVLYYDADITCRRTDVSGDYAAFFLKGLATSSPSNIVSDVGAIYEVVVVRTDANFLVDIQANNTNKSLNVLVKGVAGKTISWKCVINTIEV